jgi:hypothetical protein
MGRLKDEFRRRIVRESAKKANIAKRQASKKKK